MQHTWRWFGPNDPIRLEEIRQTGATGIVTALHEVPNDQVWSRQAIAERKQMIEDAGLEWSVVESVPVHEAIKKGLPERNALITRYCDTLRNLAACGIDTVCYNFMPVLDWTRTDLRWAMPDGALALRFDQTAFAAFDLYLLARPGAEDEYSDDEKTAARSYLDSLDAEARQSLVDTLIAGLPGAEEHYTLERFREVLAGYEEIDAERLRENLGYFLKAVIPVAEELGIHMAIHPDDPPRPLLGLPRVVSTAADAEWILGAVDSPANGLTLCTGSYGVLAANDLADMVKRFGPRIHFVHLRSTRRESPDPRSFHEAPHLNGDVDMVAVIKALVAEERRRERDGGRRLPLRPDHGHHILDDQHRATAPGYPLYGRLRGLAELRGVETAVRQLT
ncbi:mannonate dehydratase [Halomonas denitrificans]|uniref:mannonate dehydratase n=1 Tax=Halomonas TaxID=2745 RepID=UPI001A8EC471|nr:MULTISPECIES: mannonate dehydratase [Halomonas]MBN8414113.1 mannonate dehydratase [Halomonas litopenaei]MBY6027851.1 mannonate dehydratase [Halomonas sp. DP8Y7-1]MCA0972975.1 mannonate dehydratase [Halomonas denitrificans]MED5297323.1 mannonate dehydratase [Pseudomonadota bacterium]